MINQLIEGYQVLTEREIEQFKLLVNKLINVNYLTAEKEEDRSNYYFILSHLELFKNYFELSGMELNHYPTNRTLTLKSEYFSKQPLNRIGSIILLILRLLYHQKLHDISLDSGIIVTIKDIQDKYEHLNIDGEERIKKSDLEETLKILKKHNIINYKGQDYTNDDFLITIYSTISFVIDIKTLEELHNKINSYIGGADDEEITDN